MITDLLIHIGYHKTGTTWLQNELFVSGNNVFEPLSNNASRHSTVAQHFIQADDGVLLSSFDQNTAKVLSEANLIIKEVDRFAGKVPVISHERLSGNPHASGFDSKLVAHRIHKAFPRAKIFIVIREQRSFILSSYFQYLSIGGTDSLIKYLNSRYDGRRPHFSGKHVDYLPLVKEYLELFGNEKVLVLPYEQFKENPTAFMNRLGNFVGKEINVERLAFEVRRNKKEHQFVNYHFRKLNVFLKSSSVNDFSSVHNAFTRSMANAVLHLCSVTVPAKLNQNLMNSMKLDIEQWCNGRYKASNAELQSLLGMDLQLFGYEV
ncbi:MAG: sulfotransferase domain-containing protein [Flavobacteriales bacterium]|nr:sulfotransferase domain-containing protein [Flavobacteriales bacterium]